MAEDLKLVKPPEQAIQVPKPEPPKPEPPKPEPPKIIEVKSPAKSSPPAEGAEKASKVPESTYANHIALDLGKEIKKLEEIAKRAQKAGVTFAEAKTKYLDEQAQSTQIDDLNKRRVDGDFYARQRRITYAR